MDPALPAAQRSLVANGPPIHVHVVCPDNGRMSLVAHYRVAHSGLGGLGVSSSGLHVTGTSYASLSEDQQAMAAELKGEGPTLFTSFVGASSGSVQPADIIFSADIETHRGVVDTFKRLGRRSPASRGITYAIAPIKPLAADGAEDRFAALVVGTLRDVVSGAKAAAEGPSPFGATATGWDGAVEAAVERAAQLRNVDLALAVL